MLAKSYDVNLKPGSQPAAFLTVSNFLLQQKSYRFRLSIWFDLDSEGSITHLCQPVYSDSLLTGVRDGNFTPFCLSPFNFLSEIDSCMPDPTIFWKIYSFPLLVLGLRIYNTIFKFTCDRRQYFCHLKQKTLLKYLFVHQDWCSFWWFCDQICDRLPMILRTWVMYS